MQNGDYLPAMLVLNGRLMAAIVLVDIFEHTNLYGIAGNFQGQ